MTFKRCLKYKKYIKILLPPKLDREYVKNKISSCICNVLHSSNLHINNKYTFCEVLRIIVWLIYSITLLLCMIHL